MTNNYDKSVTEFLKDLHEFIDWTNRWGSPRAAREEATYFDIQGKILQGEVGIKPFLHRLRTCLEAFLEDFRKEPHGKERIGNDFVKMASDIIQHSEICAQKLEGEEQKFVLEMKKMINAVISQVGENA